MKFLVLALCVCAASAAPAYTPWQPKQGVAKAFASVVGGAPQTAAKTTYEPVAKAIYTPVKAPYKPVAKAVYTPVKATYEPVAKAVYTPVKTTYEPVAKAVYTPVKAVYEPVAKAVSVSVQPAYQPTVKSDNKDVNAAILQSKSDINADGFVFGYETANGIAAQSSGIMKQIGDNKFLAIQGQYKYIAPDGTPVELSYIADENGYQPRSDILPVGPAIPEAIIRSLEYLRTHPQKEDKKY